MKANNLTYQHQSEVCNRCAGCCCFCWLINNSIKCMIDRFHFEYSVYAIECICECLHILKRIGCSSLWRWFLHTCCCLCSGVSKYNQNNISILLDTIFYLWQACVFTSFLTLLSYAANFFRVSQWQLLGYIQNIICIYRLKIRCVVIKLCNSNLFSQ